MSQTRIWRTVTSAGLDGEQLSVQCLSQGGRRTSGWARDAICPRDEIAQRTQFPITTGVAYHLAVILGDEFVNISERTYFNIQTHGKLRGNRATPAEVAMLLAPFTQDQLGHEWVVVMHPPVVTADHIPRLLTLHREEDGVDWVTTVPARPMYEFPKSTAFVFLVPDTGEFDM